MIRKYATITPPTEEPVSIYEARAHTRVDGTEEDDLLMRLIVTAREYYEQTTWRALCTQTRVMFLDAWPPYEAIDIAGAPIVSVSELKYINEQGTEFVLPSNRYVVSARGDQRGSIALKRSAGGWPTDTLQEVDAIQITYTAGYGDPSDVPAIHKQAILLMVGHWFENREEIVVAAGVVASQMPMAAQTIIRMQRAW